MPPFLTPAQGGSILSLKVIPNARKTTFGDLLETAIKLYVCAPPVEGKANAEIVKFFKKTFALKANQIVFLSGEKSSYKQILLPLSCDKMMLFFFNDNRAPFLKNIS